MSSWVHPEESRCEEIEHHDLQDIFDEDTISTRPSGTETLLSTQRHAHTCPSSSLRVAAQGQIPELTGQRNFNSLATLSLHLPDWRGVLNSNLCWIVDFRDDNDTPCFKKHLCRGEADPLQGTHPETRKRWNVLW